MKREDKRILSRVFAIVIIILFTGWFIFWPLNKYIESPGSADNLRSYVTVPGHPDKKSGSFMITSVYLQQARPVTYLWAKVTPNTTIESAQDVTGGQSGKTFDRVQNFYMQSAINQAIAVAFKAAGKPVKTSYLGIYVLQVQKDSKFKGKINVGDTITKVNGHHFNTAHGYQKYISKQKLGAPLTVTYLHNKKQRTATAPLVKITKSRVGIGIILTDNTKVQTTPQVSVNPGKLGGPSGGLMFALQIYQQISGHDLRHGQKIAGTGTINADGTVGEIGGIDKKVVAAHRAGAKVFLAPYVKPSKLLLKYEEGYQTNYQMAKATAKKYAPGMKVVPVTSFKDTVNYLEKQAK
ncbi:SepM family pheromone-processing serine protease [uncultured Limosilactobacillus sp.]|uniref:SepM family pheromone-processing serine protease n=1 Tax=uncultured Limosilactobacillus sp. TaxID=2837629 RepID=UPI0025E35BF1|nr:SepM family pheromone-processing serine protease [uncultured Limosilactobacillus sp.]